MGVGIARGECIQEVSIAGTLRPVSRRAFLAGNDELVVLPGAQDQPTTTGTNDVAGQGVLEVPVTQTLANLGNDAPQRAVETAAQ